MPDTREWARAILRPELWSGSIRLGWAQRLSRPHTLEANMHNTNSKAEHVEEKVLDLVDSCRGRVLNVVEGQLGSSANWRIIRGQLLNIFGQKGLTGDIQRTFENSIDGGRR